MNAEDLMQLAIEKCRQGLAAGQSPFGCAISKGGHLVAAAYNSVVLSADITAHAEVNAIRDACRSTQNIFLEGAVVATTCEPCPMCMAALHWARVDTVYYGATIDDAQQAGFNELPLPAEEILRLGRSRVKLVGGILTQECKSLFDEWLRLPTRTPY